MRAQGNCIAKTDIAHVPRFSLLRLVLIGLNIKMILFFFITENDEQSV